MPGVALYVIKSLEIGGITGFESMCQIHEFCWKRMGRIIRRKLNIFWWSWNSKSTDFREPSFHIWLKSKVLQNAEGSNKKACEYEIKEFAVLDSSIISKWNRIYICNSSAWLISHSDVWRLFDCIWLTLSEYVDAAGCSNGIILSFTFCCFFIRSATYRLDSKINSMNFYGNLKF